MIDYVLRRVAYMVVVLVIISVCAYVIIQLPPGDYLTDYLARLQSRSTGVDEAMIEALRKQYGLDLPMHMQYLRWVGKMVQGDFGQSFSFQEPVSALLMERLPMTVLISLLSLVFVYVVSIPSASTPPPTSTPLPTMGLPCSVSSVWRPRTSCSRWS